MIRFFDKAEPSGLGPDGLATYRLETYFECYRDFATRIVRRARPADIAAYPAQYAAYTQARTAADEGFPLCAWPAADEAVQLGLAERGIRTVERLAAADLASAPIEYREAKERAEAFLQTLREEGPQRAAEVQRLRAEVAALAAENAELRAALAQGAPQRAARAGSRRTAAERG
ncbi:hypothetical protein SAMN02745911_0393 [Aureimonas altamirensis DSM 21988]|uniref:Chromosome segregation ATPase n=2 Tax=Aureimonas altamirensis TaxID=370622 RepID=A0A0P0YWV8_9HYPH|nr:hypothetical protein [Aureimonas altamirensis]BAT25898.1 chromosome segregation ATPase [Aureimonas altamirensis]SHI51574.1 hypothetical protein SAMN02745911_0393 [Aureimonas altamirensis DSM 21988]